MALARSLLLRLAALCALCPALAEGKPPAADAAPKVIIVGSGLAGLVTAYELQQHGVTAQLLEAGDAFGGRVATMHYAGGLKAEAGMHEIWASDPLFAYVKKLGVPLAPPSEAFSSVYMDDHLYPYVQDTARAYHQTLFSADELQAFERWRTACTALFDQAEAHGLTPATAPLQDISYAAWVASLKLPDRVEAFLRLNIECEVAADWGQISALYGILQNRMFLHGTEQCFHAREGNESVIKAFLAALKGPRTLGARVTRIVRTRQPDGSTRATVYYRKDHILSSLQAEKVVVAVPYHVLHAIQMEPGLSEEQWEAVDTLSAGQYTVVHFILDTRANDILLVDGKNPFPVLTHGPLGVVYGFSELPAAGQKEEVFSLLVHGDYSRTYLEPQDRIRTRLLEEMDKIWPRFSTFVRETHFYNHHPAATPSWPVGRSPLDAVHQSLRQESVGLYLAGDYVYSSHADGAVRSGQAAARDILRDLGRPVTH